MLWRRWLFTAFLCFAAFGAAALKLPAAPPNAQSITGVIDGVPLEGDQYLVHGWARQQGQQGPIAINIYATHSADGKPSGTYVAAGNAETGQRTDSRPRVPRRKRREAQGQRPFVEPAAQGLLGEKLFMHGVALIGNVVNAALAASGKYTLPAPR